MTQLTGTTHLQNNRKTINKMAIVNSYLSINALNVNRLKSPLKRYRMAEWIKKKKEDPTTCCLKEIHFRLEDTIE